MNENIHLKQKLQKCFQYFPEGALKNYLVYLFYTRIQKNGFELKYNSSYLTVVLDNSLSIMFYNYKGIPFFKKLLHGYLKNYDLKKGDIVIDAGAYVGEFTLYCAKVVGEEGKVLAFEPDPSNYEQLVKNIKLNKLDNVIALNKGLWNRNTSLKLREQFGLGSSFIYPNSSQKSIEIPVVKLDSEIKKWNLNKVDFIKMDIEGAEIEAIMGSEIVLKKCPVNLAIASYHIVNGSQTYITLEKMFSDLGYKCNTSFPYHLTTYASKDVDL